VRVLRTSNVDAAEGQKRDQPPLRGELVRGLEPDPAFVAKLESSSARSEHIASATLHVPPPPSVTVAATHFNPFAPAFAI
jgi:hypothetical protein